MPKNYDLGDFRKSAFCDSLPPDIQSMTDDIQKLLRLIEHKNASDAQWLLWQKEGHPEGYPSVGVFRISSKDKIAIGEQTRLDEAKDAGSYWGPHHRIKGLRFDKLLCGHIIFEEYGDAKWQFTVYLPRDVEATDALKEHIRLAFCLPEASTAFRFIS